MKGFLLGKKRKDTETRPRKLTAKSNQYTRSRSPPAGARTVAPRAPKPIPTSPLSRAWFPGSARLHFWFPSFFISYEIDFPSGQFPPSP